VAEHIGSGKGWYGTLRMVAASRKSTRAAGRDGGGWLAVGRVAGERESGWLHARHCFEQACTRTYIYLAHR